MHMQSSCLNFPGAFKTSTNLFHLFYCGFMQLNHKYYRWIITSKVPFLKKWLADHSIYIGSNTWTHGVRSLSHPDLFNPYLLFPQFVDKCVSSCIPIWKMPTPRSTCWVQIVVLQCAYVHKSKGMHQVLSFHNSWRLLGTTHMNRIGLYSCIEKCIHH